MQRPQQTANRPSQPVRSRRAYGRIDLCWILACLTLAGVFFYKAAPDWGEPASHLAAAVAQSAATTEPVLNRTQRTPSLVTRPIETIQVGDRVLRRHFTSPTANGAAAEVHRPEPTTLREGTLNPQPAANTVAPRNPVVLHVSGVDLEITGGVITRVSSEGDASTAAGFQGLVGSRYRPGSLHECDVTRELWRRLDLVLDKPDGSRASIQLLRPLWWLGGLTGEPGEQIDLTLHELGLEGSATLVGIGPCDVDSRENPPDTYVVTGTIQHKNAVVYDLVFDGAVTTSLGVTANHPIYSYDRDDWVPAGELRLGEHVTTTDGRAVLTAKTPRPGAHDVYNLEVHRSHSYHVSHLGVLAHNTGIDCSVADDLSKKTWQDFLPEAERRLAASRAKYGDGVVMMALSRKQALTRLEGLKSTVLYHLDDHIPATIGKAPSAIPHWRKEVGGFLNQMERLAPRVGEKTGAEWKKSIDAMRKRLDDLLGEE